jgi:DNA-binding transcriptional LysR family regulator
MDTKKIKSILSAIEYKSFSKAADALSYTPSALSHIADNLEQELGVKIIIRSPLGISLSKEGEELYDYMLAIVEAEKKLMSASLALSKATENHLRIGTFSSISQKLLPEIIRQFRSQHSDIKISVAVEDNLQDWLENDLVDIIFADELSFGCNNIWLPIKEDPFVAVVPSDLFKGKRKISKEELYQHTYISISEKILDSYFDKSRFTNVLNFESVDNVSVLYMIQQNLGFSILPQLMVDKRIQGIKVLKLEEPICRTIGFAYKNVKPTYATKTFINHLINYEIKNKHS